MILPASDPAAIAACADTIRAGGLISLPTETVYGLGADACNDDAVVQIYATKGRPADHPLIVHIAATDGGMSGLAHFARDVPPFAKQLMAAFWPGPLTLILPRRPGVATAAAGGQDTIGLRCPAHQAAQALLAALRRPEQGNVVWGIAAPSANRFGRVSPTTAEHVRSELGDALMVLDAGPCAVGIESTIVDCTRQVPILLRPGSIGAIHIQEACGLALASDSDKVAPRASGTLASHYAPRALVRLMDAATLQTTLDQGGYSACANGATTIAVYARTQLSQTGSHVLLQAMPSSPDAVAHELFAVLRSLDATGVEQIWVETPPLGWQWDGVRDRLERASYTKAVPLN
jgi:L-threonylcarbamoyladenylate synthase